MKEMTESVAAKGTQPHQRRRRRTIIIGAAIAAVLIIIALAVGLGVGLTQGNGESSPSGEPSSSASPSATPTVPSGNTTVWQPKARTTWQIALQNALALSPDADAVEPDVEVFDIDLFENPASTIDTLHRLGKRVICYFSAGSYEPYRSDSSQFRQSDMGRAMDGWPDEKWLDINSQNVRRIMADRIALARRKGCDAVDPDNVDGYNNENGLGLSAEDSVGYVRYLARQATANGLAIGLKNAAEIIPQVLSDVQFSVNEQCSEYQECASFAPFIQRGKPVFHIEYPSERSKGRVAADAVSRICSRSGDAAGSEGFSTIIKDMDLDGWAEYCDGSTVTTALQE